MKTFEEYKKFRAEGNRPAQFRAYLDYQQRCEAVGFKVSSSKKTGLPVVTWEESGFSCQAVVEVDDLGDYLHYGSFTDEWKPGVIARGKIGRHEFKYYEPTDSLSDLISSYRSAGLSKHDSYVSAVGAQRYAMKRLESVGTEWYPYLIIVSVQKLGIEMARQVLGAVEFSKDFEYELKLYLMEMKDEVIKEAHERVGFLCQELCNSKVAQVHG